MFDISEFREYGQESGDRTGVVLYNADSYERCRLTYHVTSGNGQGHGPFSKAHDPSNGGSDEILKRNGRGNGWTVVLGKSLAYRREFFISSYDHTGFRDF